MLGTEVIAYQTLERMVKGSSLDTDWGSPIRVSTSKSLEEPRRPERQTKWEIGRTGTGLLLAGLGK